MYSPAWGIIKFFNIVPAVQFIAYLPGMQELSWILLIWREMHGDRSKIDISLIIAAFHPVAIHLGGLVDRLLEIN